MPDRGRLRSRCLVLAVAVLAAAAGARAAGPGPSRKPVKGCRWEKLSDAAVGLEAWVQRCDFGFRKIDFLFEGSSLAIRYSDGGAPEPLVDVLELESGETPEAGIRRLFDARTDPAIARRCVLVPERVSRTKPPAGVRRYTFVPDAAFAKEVAAKADPNEIGEPSCGDWGESPDGIQYFEAHPKSRAGSRRVLFVRVGQDEPLFDERTLVLTAPR